MADSLILDLESFDDLHSLMTMKFTFNIHGLLFHSIVSIVLSFPQIEISNPF